MLIQRNIIGSCAYVGRGSMPEDFTWAWGQMIQYTNEAVTKPGQIVNWMRGNMSGQHLARNHCAAMMLGEWLLMLDCDHTFEPDLIKRMLYIFDRDGLDVLTGLYQYKEAPFEPVLYKFHEGGYRHIGLDKIVPRQTIQIDAAGAGTLMIRRRVFERIAAELGERPFDLTRGPGEDFNFFKRLEMLGIQAYCCPSIQTYHLSTREVTMDDYDPNTITTMVRLSIPGMKDQPHV